MRYVTDWRKSIGMQLYTIEMTDLAQLDLESLGDYIAFELSNPMAAERIVHGIRMRVNKLKQFPMKYRLDEDTYLAELGVHRVNFENYEIFYIVDEVNHIVYVIRILHSLTDYKTQLYRTLNI